MNRLFPFSSQEQIAGDKINGFARSGKPQELEVESQIKKIKTGKRRKDEKYSQTFESKVF